MDISHKNTTHQIFAGQMMDISHKKYNSPNIVSGQMMAISPCHLIFMCSAKMCSLSEMIEKKLYISDLAVYDMTREFVLLNQLRHAEIDIR